MHLIFASSKISRPSPWPFISNDGLVIRDNEQTVLLPGLGRRTVS